MIQGMRCRVLLWRQKRKQDILMIGSQAQENARPGFWSGAAANESEYEAILVKYLRRSVQERRAVVGGGAGHRTSAGASPLFVVEAAMRCRT